MAAPLYEEDLTDISLAEASTTGYLQVNFAGGGGGALDFGPDFSMQGNDAILRQVTNNDRGAAFDNAATIARSDPYAGNGADSSAIRIAQ